MQFRTLLSLTSTLVLLAGCGQSSPQRAPNQPPASAAKSAEPAAPTQDGFRPFADLPLKLLWDVQFPGPVHASHLAPIEGGHLHVQLEDHSLYALDRFSGNQAWKNRALPELLTLTPTVAQSTIKTPGGDTLTDTRLYAIMQDTLFCLDDVSGNLIWRYYLSFTPSSGPAASGSTDNLRVFIGDWGRSVHAIGLLSDKMVPYRVWMHPLAGQVTATPVIADGLVYVADQAGMVSCFTGERELSWQTDIGGTLWASPVVAGKLLLVGTSDNALVFLDRYSGQNLGRIHLPGSVTRLPLVFRDDSGAVFVWTDANGEKPAGLWRLDIRSDQTPGGELSRDSGRPNIDIVRNAKRWFVPGVNRVVGSTPHHLLLMGDQPVITAVHRQSGAVAWRWDLNQGRTGERRFVHVTTYLDPWDQTRMVFLVDARHRLSAYRIFDGNDLEQIRSGR